MYFSKKINYKEPFKNFTFLLLIFFFINNLIALKAGENISFGNSEKINTKLESIFNQNTINALHKAYKLIFRSSNNPTNTKELEALSKDFKEVSKLLNFIEKSERGVIQSSKQDD